MEPQSVINMKWDLSVITLCPILEINFVGKYEYKHIYFVSDMGMLTVISHKAAELYRSDNYVVGTFFL